MGKVEILPGLFPERIALPLGGRELVAVVLIVHPLERMGFTPLSTSNCTLLTEFCFLGLIYRSSKFRRVTLPLAFGILMSMEPVLAALSGIIFLGEQLNVAQWVALRCV